MTREAHHCSSGLRACGLTLPVRDDSAARVLAAGLLLLAACLSSNADSESAPDDTSEVEAGSWTADPSGTQDSWESAYLDEVQLLFDDSDAPPLDKEFLAVGHVACEELEYDCGDGTFSGGRAAVARVQGTLGEDEVTSWQLVEAASDRMCEWSQEFDMILDLPPLSEFTD
ncbi:hypothetical protein ACFC4G_42580 [Streptomyces sp. NPDC056002]|uniref:hypothetical protein n=1 Tax=Streptomyces sp. NPDC056002 TaxID=3345675 RepID=UPI0035D732BC